MSNSDITMLFVYAQSKKFKFKAESPFKRIQWLIALNSFTQNLSDSLKIIEYPVYKGQVYKKNLDANVSSRTSSASALHALTFEGNEKEVTAFVEN